MKHDRAIQLLNKYVGPCDYETTDYEAQIEALEKRLAELRADIVERDAKDADLRAAIEILKRDIE